MLTVKATDGLSTVAFQMKRGRCYPDPFWVDSFECLRRWGFPCGSAGKECLQCGRPGFDPCWEDPLEKGATTHSSILAWRIPWTVQSMGSQRVGHDRATFTWKTGSSLNWGSVNWRREGSCKKPQLPKLLFKSLAFFSEQQSFMPSRWDGIKGELWLSLIPGLCGGWSREPAVHTLCPLHSLGGPAFGGGFYRIA